MLSPVFQGFSSLSAAAARQSNILGTSEACPGLRFSTLFCCHPLTTLLLHKQQENSFTADEPRPWLSFMCNWLYLQVLRTQE